MTSPLPGVAPNWLDQYTQVFINGTAVTTTRHGLNLIAGTGVTITYVDDPANDSTDITISSTGGGGGTTPNRMTGAGTFVTTGPNFANTSGGSWTGTFPASPTDGQAVTIKDNVGAWGTHALTVQGASGQKVENPNAPGTYSAAAGTQVLSATGGAVTFVWGATEATWLVV